ALRHGAGDGDGIHVWLAADRRARHRAQGRARCGFHRHELRAECEPARLRAQRSRRSRHQPDAQQLRRLVRSRSSSRQDRDLSRAGAGGDRLALELRQDHRARARPGAGLGPYAARIRRLSRRRFPRAAMTATTAIAGPARLSLEEKLLFAAIGYFLALKLGFAIFAAPFAAQPFYWPWGRRFALSYYDHPPLQGWLQGLSYMLFGRSVFALRWMAFAALAVNLWIFALVARRLAGEAWRPFFLRSAAVYLASPLFGFFGTV